MLFGFWGQGSPVSAVATLPEIVWEAFLGIFFSFVLFTPRQRARVARRTVSGSPQTSAA